MKPKFEGAQRPDYERAAWLVEDDELVPEMLRAHRAYHAAIRLCAFEAAQWHRAYYWSLRREISKRWR